MAKTPLRRPAMRMRPIALNRRSIRRKNIRMNEMRVTGTGRAFADNPAVPSNVGILSPLEPYAGPKEFWVSAPHKLIKFAKRGKIPDAFLVRRDPALNPPYGGFRISYKGKEVGRSVSWPTYEDCRRIRRDNKRLSRPNATNEELDDATEA